MNKKISIRVIAVTLVMLLLMSTMQIFAEYSPGPTTYELDKSYMLSASGASVSDGNIVLDANGSIKFDMFLPFDSDSLTLTYNTLSSDALLTVITDENTYTSTLSSGTSSKTLEITEVLGSKGISFTANSALTLTGVSFGKVNENYNAANNGNIPLNDYEDATLTSVIFKNDGAALKTRGAVLRWDIENIRLVPHNIDGNLYVPFEKFAESLGYYSENYPDKLYIYMSGETKSLALIGGKGYIEEDGKQKQELNLNIIYKEGTTWVPVRAIAEALGFYVAYKDGYVVIDDRLKALNVINDENVFASLKAEMDAYIPTEETEGTTYYVDQNASGSSSEGTQENPFLTIQEASLVAEAGDTVIIHEGTYREIVKPQNNGTVFAPITFKAAKGEKVVISALEKISGFTAYEGDIVKATLEKDLGRGRNQLFYKGEALNQGRHPNKDTKPGVVPYPDDVPEGLYATRGDMHIEELTWKSNIVTTDTDDLDQPDNYWKGGNFITLKGTGYSLVGGDIVSSTKGQLTVKNYDGVKSYHLGLSVSETQGNDYYFRDAFPTDYGYITDHLNTVDIEGEWYADSDKDTIYLIPPTGADLENDFEVKRRQICINLKAKQYITFENIDTIGGGITMAGDTTEGCVLNGGGHKYIAHHTILLDQSGYELSTSYKSSTKRTIKNGEAGICVDGKNNVIVNSIIDHSSATGVTLLGKYHYIHNNVIKNTSYSGGYPGAIWITPDSSKTANVLAQTIFGGHYITRNSLKNSGRSVILMGSTVGGVNYAFMPIEIAYNRFSNGALTTRDTGITYEYAITGGNDRSKTRMHHNFIYNPGYKDADTDTQLMMLYQDGYTAARDTYSNVTYFEELDKAPYHQVFVQDAAYSVLRSRNNAELGYLENGESSIDRAEYPGGRPFNPGSYLENTTRFTKNYDDLKASYSPYYPTSSETLTSTEKYVFENVKINANLRTKLHLYLNREVGAVTTFKATACVYDASGNLVTSNSLTNTAQTERFYVYELHKAMVVLDSIKASGTYKVVVEFSDTASDLQRMNVEFENPAYDNLYTELMANTGTVAYLPTSTSESTSSETATFENVQINSGEYTLLDLHLERDFIADDKTTVNAKVYSGSTLVQEQKLFNTISHNRLIKNDYDVVSAKVVLKPIATSGKYKVVLTLSGTDTLSKPVRLLAGKASDEYQNVFNEDIIIANTYDTAKQASGTSAVIPGGSITTKNLNNYTYGAVGDTYKNTLIYKNRTINEASNTLKYTYQTGDGYEGQTVTISTANISANGSVTNKVKIAEFVIPEIDMEKYKHLQNWKPQTLSVDLASTLAEGTYNFIIEYAYPVDESGSIIRRSTSTIYNFSFCNE